MTFFHLAFIDSPQVILPEEEKIINEVITGNQTVIEEKYVVQIFFLLLFFTTKSFLCFSVYFLKNDYR